MIDITEAKGRDQDNNVLVNMLLNEHSVDDRVDIPVISLVGMGGIGKSTLTQFAFNHYNTETYLDKKI
uniref:NB-ARC domain-containing protein n=1 Tax=Rhizophora mucronata TaxID=61149 RepID=A0A2P2JDB2_RHIMU